jgi:hypothetical protein
MDIPQDWLNWIIGLGIPVGCIQCFFGFRIFKIILGLMGFLIGALLAGALGSMISQDGLVVLLTALVGGLIGSMLMVALYVVGVFLMGAFLGGTLGVVLASVAQSDPEPATLLILAVIGGVLAVIFQKFMIIVSTGFGGSWNVVTGIAYFTIGDMATDSIEQMVRSGGSQNYAMLLCWIVLGLLGVATQYKMLPTPETSGDMNKTPNDRSG